MEKKVFKTRDKLNSLKSSLKRICILFVQIYSGSEPGIKCGNRSYAALDCPVIVGFQNYCYYLPCCASASWILSLSSIFSIHRNISIIRINIQLFEKYFLTLDDGFDLNELFQIFNKMIKDF